MGAELFWEFFFGGDFFFIQIYKNDQTYKYAKTISEYNNLW